MTNHRRDFSTRVVAVELVCCCREQWHRIYCILLVYGSNALYRLQFMFVHCVSVSVCLFVFLFRLAAYTIQGGSK